jgi:signal transduction histidine kinase
LIMEQMHGSIRLDSSALGVGTTFSFTLPLSSHDH